MIVKEKNGKELFDQLFSSQPLAVVWFTPLLVNSRLGEEFIGDFKVEFCNEAACSILNLYVSDAMGSSVLASELMDHTSRTHIYEQCLQVFETGEPSMFTYHSPKLDRWYVVQRSKVMGGVLSIIQDKTIEINLQRDTEEQDRKIKEQARILDLILNSSICGVYLLEAIYEDNGVSDFKIIHVNDVLCRMAGKTRKDLVGKMFSNTFPDAVKQGLAERNAQVLKTGIDYRNEFHFVGDGVDRWYETSVCKATDHKLVISFNDITRLKLASLELEAANAHLKESNRRLGEFAQFVSHDLKAPVRKIASYNDILQTKLKDYDDRDVAMYLHKVDNMTQRMHVLIRDLLLFSETDNLLESFETIPLNDILFESRHDFETAIAQKEVTLTVGSLPDVKGDRTLLTQVFQNLISNSIKFRTSHKTTLIQIEYTGKTRRNGVEYFAVEVKDNGIGFEQSNAERIFEPFQRLNTFDKFEGSGVGLTLVKRVMEKHRGLIEVKSEPGVGTAFILLFRSGL
jgi:PAS domain S-box-containing protein